MQKLHSTKLCIHICSGVCTTREFRTKRGLLLKACTTMRKAAHNGQEAHPIVLRSVWESGKEVGILSTDLYKRYNRCECITLSNAAFASRSTRCQFCFSSVNIMYASSTDWAAFLRDDPFVNPLCVGFCILWINGCILSLITACLHHNAESCIKWAGSTSNCFKVGMGAGKDVSLALIFINYISTHYYTVCKM
jgi:hypothetical protein